MSGDVVSALGIPAMRWELLVQVSRESRTITQLMQTSGLSRSGVRIHLKRLLEAELVTVQPSSVPWSYKPVDVYSADRDRIRDVLVEFADRL